MCQLIYDDLSSRAGLAEVIVQWNFYVGIPCFRLYCGPYAACGKNFFLQKRCPVAGSFQMLVGEVIAFHDCDALFADGNVDGECSVRRGMAVDVGEHFIET